MMGLGLIIGVLLGGGACYALIYRQTMATLSSVVPRTVEQTLRRVAEKQWYHVDGKVYAVIFVTDDPKGEFDPSGLTIERDDIDPRLMDEPQGTA